MTPPRVSAAWQETLMKHSSVCAPDENFHLLCLDKKGCSLKSYNAERV